jgi:hypothetical protein
MNVLLCCLPFIRLRRPPRPRLRQPPAEPELRDADAPLSGCGWFDSSWELLQGLAVTECGDDAPLPRDLPVSGLMQ